MIGVDPLAVEVRLMVEPPLWCWRIHDPLTGVIDSWTDEWEAYASAEDAYTAAFQRVRSLRVRRTADTPPPSPRDAFLRWVFRPADQVSSTG